MEIFQNKADMLKRMQMPQYQAKGGVFAYFLSVLLWGIILIAIGFALYVHWFSRSLVFLLSFIHKGAYYFPFWMALLVTIVAFPFSIIIIILAILLKNFKRQT